MPLSLQTISYVSGCSGTDYSMWATAAVWHGMHTGQHAHTHMHSVGSSDGTHSGRETRVPRQRCVFSHMPT